MMKRVLVMTLLGMAVLAQSSFAAITGGNAAITRAFNDVPTDFSVIDLNTPISGAGQITQWQIFAANTNAVALLLYHPAGGGVYNLLGQSPQATPVAGVNNFTLTTPITVQAGDVVGLFFPGTASVPFDLTGPLLLGNLTGSALLTATGTGISIPTNSSQRVYSVNVTGNLISATPVPPSVMLTLVGLAMLAFFGASRKFARA
jgi:hypothetical protein